MKHVTQLKADTLTTKQMDERIHQVSADIRRYREIEASAELAEFMALKPQVEAKEFQDYKRELLTTKFQDRPEYATRQEYAKIKKSRHVRWYKFYLGMSSVHEYNDFAQTSDFAKLNDPEAVKADPRLRRMQKLGKSFAVRRYNAHKESEDLKKYFELQQKVNTTEFREAYNFWKNPNRWYTTLQSKQDGKYEALKNSSNISFFLAQDPKQIARYEAYQEIFADGFEWNRMQDSSWKPGFFYGKKNLKTNHSYANEEAAMNSGRNIGTKEGRLIVAVKNERVSAPAWDEKKGFIMKDFDYTGDVIQTAEDFRAAEGMFQVKASFSGKANGAICLVSENHTPIVRIAQWDGEKVTVGATFKEFEEQTVIEGLKEGQEYIFTVNITPSDITWFVNNQEVARTANKLGAKLFPIVMAFLPKGVKSTGATSVDWFKVYKLPKA